jgi:hypothetical protein
MLPQRKQWELIAYWMKRKIIMTFKIYPTQKDEEGSFTGLFSILKNYQIAPNGLPVLAFNLHELQLLHRHSDDGVKILLQGLQELGLLLGKQSHNDLGFFIYAICNLIEALDSLRSDINYVLSNKENLFCNLS